MKIVFIKFIVLLMFCQTMLVLSISRRHTYVTYTKQDLTLPSQNESHTLEVQYSTTKYLDENTVENFVPLTSYTWRYSTLIQYDDIIHDPLYNGCKTEFTAYPLFMIDLANGLINNYWNKFYVAWMLKTPAPLCLLNKMTLTYKVRFFNTQIEADNFYTQLDGNIGFKTLNDITLVGQSGRIKGNTTLFQLLSSDISPC